ncbi:MAG: hypothetical protein Faunusvirus6_6 [Faunusvirus sp.]|uniref:Uncharacterized protein n=1 Tax=Faunusvirus sp. TaxID=2487766 RepID=A0A3G4ZWE4_9VIRU|nr:MAG: hypothetical protein Faunusvirus6_6 [Faunusvirus sp.]
MNLQTVSNNIEFFLNDKYVSAIMAIVLIVYSGVVAPKLPASVARYLHNDIARLVAFFLIAYLATKNAVVALVAAIAVIATLQAVNYHRINGAEHMTNSGSQWTWVGLFKDTTNRALPVNLGAVNINNTVAECAGKSKNYKYFAIQNNNECWAGNSGYNKHGSVQETNARMRTQGGILVNAVYEHNVISPAAQQINNAFGGAIAPTHPTQSVATAIGATITQPHPIQSTQTVATQPHPVSVTPPHSVSIAQPQPHPVNNTQVAANIPPVNNTHIGVAANTNAVNTVVVPHNTPIPDSVVVQMNDRNGNMSHELSCHWQ